MKKKTVLERFQDIKELEVADGNGGSKTVEELLPYFCKNVEEALLRLEKIDNAKPSEALECLEEICNDKTIHDYILYNCLDEGFTTVIHSLLKAQDLEKENAKYRQLEEQLGCPLDVRCNVFYNSTIYNCLGYKMTVKETYDGHFIAVIENDIFSFDYKDYKKTWWLKEDKSEKIMDELLDCDHKFHKLKDDSLATELDWSRKTIDPNPEVAFLGVKDCTIYLSDRQLQELLNYNYKVKDEKFPGGYRWNFPFGGVLGMRHLKLINKENGRSYEFEEVKFKR